MFSEDTPPAPYRDKAKVDQHLRSWSFGLALAAGTMALVILLVGSAAGIDQLTRVQIGLPGMVPATAASLSGIAAALLLAIGPRDRRWQRVGFALAAVVGIYAALRFGIRLSMENTDLMAAPFAPPKDDMSLATSLSLLMAAVSTMVLSSPSAQGDGRLRWLCRVAASCGLILVLVALDGYLFDPQALQQVGVFRAMALPTALCLAVLFCALLLASAEEGWVANLFAPSRGGRLARRTLPLILILPLLMHFLPLHRLEDALPRSHFQLGLFAVTVTLFAAVMVLRAAARINVTEASARIGERQLRQILDGVDAAVFALDGRGDLRMTNQRAEALANAMQAASPVAWLYDTPFHTLEGERRILRPAERPAARILASGRLMPIDLGCLGPDGQEKMLHFTVNRMPDPDSGDLFVLSVQDRTADQMLPSAPQAANENASNGTRHSLSPAMIHNLSNIFGAIRLSADAGLLRDDHHAARRYFNAIKTACSRGMVLTEGNQSAPLSILADSRPLQVFDVTVALFDAVAQARKLIAPPIRVEGELPERALWVRCDPAALNTVVLNLLINARNAIAADGRTDGEILVCIEERTDALCITIIDNGPGMSPDVLSRATEPFFTSGDTQGGLGLATAVAFAQENGGHFELTSREGMGTVARLQLPAAPPPGQAPPPANMHSAPAAEKEVKPAASLVTGTGISLKGLRVLVVEDDPLYGDILAESLRILGADIEMCQNGTQVESFLIEAGTAAPFDVLVTDINLPGPRDGYDVADLLRLHQPDIKVVFMSGFGAPAAGIDPATQGTFLRKPVSVAKMAAAIAASAQERLHATKD
ncbi:ATP-binding protein [Pseudooceanicola spongiae]|uniref:histidine kinase n=1 Tax=Pseudooceanicola spongiae TaxID=2613965 RepID=A0A7L9WR02_9RHOB|nr:ATP-binding protein [Pseudooceanicola spongiae]QOL82312.1 response regulator [Pseudooceanicola spongiae]